MAMHKSLFDLSIEETTSTEMPHTVKFSNETGTGSMIICPLFLGAELYYNDMHLAFFEEATAPMRNVIEINHCRVGRYECSGAQKVVLLLSAAALPRHHHPTGSGCDFAGNAETNGMVRRRP